MVRGLALVVILATAHYAQASKLGNYARKAVATGKVLATKGTAIGLAAQLLLASSAMSAVDQDTKQIARQQTG